MVLQNKVSKVLTVCLKIGGELSECMQYLPLEKESIEQPMTFGDIQVNLKAVEESTYIVTRVLDVAGFEVTHYHFNAWDDLKAPEDDTLTDFRCLIKDLAKFIMA